MVTDMTWNDFASLYYEQLKDIARKYLYNMNLTFNKEISRKIRNSIHYDQEKLKTINNTH